MSKVDRTMDDTVSTTPGGGHDGTVGTLQKEREPAARPFFDRYNALVDNGWLAVLSPPLLRVYLCYLRHADRDSIAYPSNQRLAEAIGQSSASHVRRARAKLIELGLLTRVSRGGNHPGDTSHFRVNVPPPIPPAGLPSDGGRMVRSGGAPAPETRTCAADAQVRRGDTRPCAAQARDGAPGRRTEGAHRRGTLKEGVRARARTGEGGQAAEPGTNCGRKQPAGDHAALIAYFCSCWLQKHGRDYHFRNGQDGKAAAAVLKAARNLDGAKRMIDAYLRDADPFLVRQCHPLATLQVRINSYTAAATAPHVNGNGWHPPPGGSVTEMIINGEH